MPETHLRSHLNTLEGSGLIRQAAREPYPEYAFRHVLSQEAAYGSMLKQDRRRLHLDVGECLERGSTESPDDLAPVLARHFDEAGDDARALTYLLRAAESAARRYAAREAILLLDRAQVIALRGGSSGTVICDVTIRAGQLRATVGDYDAALATYDALEALAAERDDLAMKAQTILARATIFCAPTSRFDAERGKQEVNRALQLAAISGDRAAESKALWLLLVVSKFESDVPGARRAGETSAAIARELGLKEQLAFTLNDLHMAYVMTGDPDKGLRALQEAEDLWREIGNLPLLADTLSNLGDMLQMAGQLSESERTVQEAIRIAEMTGNLWGQSFSRLILAQILLAQGRYSESMREADISVSIGKTAGFSISQIWMPCHLAECLIDLGQPERGLIVAREALEAAASFLPSWRLYPLATASLCATAMGDCAAATEAIVVARPDRPERDFSTAQFILAEMEYVSACGTAETVLRTSTEASQVLNSFNCHIYQPMILTCVSRSMRALGRFAESEGAALEAIALAGQMGVHRWVWQAWSALTDVLGAQGREAEAGLARERARTEIAYIAGHAGGDNLRLSFLALPDVRRILEES